MGISDKIKRLEQLQTEQTSFKGFASSLETKDSKHPKGVREFFKVVADWASLQIDENEITASEITKNFKDLVSNKPAPAPAPRQQAVATPLPTVVDTTTKSPAAVLRRQKLEFVKKYQGLSQKPINVILANGQKSEGLVTALNYPNVVVFLKTGGQIEVDPENFTVRSADGKEEAKAGQ